MAKLEISEELRELLLKLNNNEIANRLMDCTIDLEKKGYINYLDRSKDHCEYMSYLTKERIERMEPESYYTDQKKRVHTSPVKVVEKLFEGVFSQRDKELFYDKFKNACKVEKISTDGLVLVEGEDIRKYYHQNNYAHYENYPDWGSGSLWGSCMRYPKCQKYFDIYVKNTNYVSMAVLFDGDDKVIGRCIIWYPEGKENSDKVYYDRIYAINNKFTLDMQAMLDKMNFINISGKNYNKCDSRNIVIDLDYGQDELEYFPYVDTMYYIDGKRISNDSFGECAEMQQQDGGLEDNSHYCERCDERVDEGDLYYIERGDYRYSNLCSGCCVYSERYSCSISTSNSVYLEEESDYVLESDAVMDYNGNYIYKGDAIQLYSGEWADENDHRLLQCKDGSYFIKGDDEFVLIGDYYYKTDSVDIEEIDGEYYLIGSEEYENALEQLMTS